VTERALLVCLLCPAWDGRGSVFVVEPGEPGREPVDGDLELWRGIDELPQPLGEPAHADLLAAPPLGKLLDAPVGEVHALAAAQHAIDDRLVVGGVRD